jgi:DNA-binding GntR family transcriptional regulator
LARIRGLSVQDLRTNSRRTAARGGTIVRPKRRVALRWSPETLYRALYDAIASHELRPGQKLTEEVIGEIFDVGRSVIRPILRRLAADGVVELFPNRGAFVTRPAVKEAREVFEVRRLIEGGIVSGLTGLDPALVERLDLHVLEEDMARRNNDNKMLLCLAGDFHMLLAQVSTNATLHKILRDLVTRSVLATALYQRSGGSGCRTDDHRAVVRLLEAGKFNEAGLFVVEHLNMVERSLDFDQSENSFQELRAVLGEIRGRR